MVKRILIILFATFATFFATGPSFADGFAGGEVHTDWNYGFSDTTPIPMGLQVANDHYEMAKNTSSPLPGQESSVDARRGAFFLELERTTDFVRDRVKTVTSRDLLGAGLGIADGLIVPAMALVGGLAVLHLAVLAIDIMAGRTPALQALLDTAIPVSITTMFIGNYKTLMTPFAGLLDVLKNVGGGIDATLTKLFSLYKGVFLIVAFRIFDAFGQILFSIRGGLSGVLYALMELVLSVFFCIVIFFIALASMAQVVALIFMGPFLFAVGVAFGPICIAGLASPWTRDWIRSWFGFMVNAAALTGVTSVLVHLIVTVMDGLQLDQAFFGTGPPVAAQLGTLAVLLIAFTSLLSQAPAVTSALFPGTLGARDTGGAAAARAGATAARPMMSAAAVAGGAAGGFAAGMAMDLARHPGGINPASVPEAARAAVQASGGSGNSRPGMMARQAQAMDNLRDSMNKAEHKQNPPPPPGPIAGTTGNVPASAILAGTNPMASANTQGGVTLPPSHPKPPGT